MQKNWILRISPYICANPKRTPKANHTQTLPGLVKNSLTLLFNRWLVQSNSSVCVRRNCTFCLNPPQLVTFLCIILLASAIDRLKFLFTFHRNGTHNFAALLELRHTKRDHFCRLKKIIQFRCDSAGR